MNCRDYYRNSEALYMMELIMSQLDAIEFESTQRVGTYLIFDSGHYLFRIIFNGYKHNINNFFAALSFILANIHIKCNINEKKVMLV